MEGYRLFRRAGPGGRGSRVALYGRERFGRTALAVGDDVVESLWVSIRGMEDKADGAAGVHHPSPSQDDSTDEFFHRELGEISGSVTLVLVGDFNVAGISRECHPAVTSRSGRFLELVEDGFLAQVLSDTHPAARGEDHGEAGCPPAAHGRPRWSRYPPAARGGPHAGAGGCPEDAVTPWEARAGAGSWQDLRPHGERSPR